MKKVLLLLMIIPMIVVGQTKELQELGIKASSVVSTPFTQICYVGVDNPITIASQGILNKKLTVSSDNGTVTCINAEHGEWIVTPSKKGRITISIFERVINKDLFGRATDTTELKIGTWTIVVYDLPPPKVYWTLSDDTVTSVEIFNSSLRYRRDEHLKNFKGIKYRIVSYDVIRQSSITGETIVAKSCITLHSGAGRNIISKAEPGDYIIIENIKYTTNGNRKYRLPISIKKVIK